MKRLIAVVAILSAGVLSASENGANIFGALPVNSTSQRTVVAIPWIQASTTNGEIMVADVVKTANLDEGDTLHYYNGENFESWQLSEKKKWVPATEVDEKKKIVAGIDPDKRALKRGNALILMRKTNHSAPFYLWGQVAPSTSTATTSITKGANNLIAPPTATTVGAELGATWSNVHTKDRVYIPTSTGTVECKYDGGVWKKYVDKGADEIGVSTWDWDPIGDNPIVLGTGFWYSAHKDSTVTLQWNNVPGVGQ